MMPNNIYNQEQLIARNVQERAHTKELKPREPRQGALLFPAIRRLFGRRETSIKQEEQAR
jgi:hypothetical protein